MKAESIGESAFENCVQIQYINFLDVLVTVGARAFDGCRALRFLDLYALPEATLGNSVFANTAGGNPAIYGAGHKQIIIQLTN